MIAKKSVLVLNDFAITKSVSEIFLDETIANNNEFREIQDKYDIDVDFDIYKNDEYSTASIMIKISINQEKKKGYYIYVEGMGIFSFNKIEDITEKERNDLILYSGLSMCITNIRTYISNMTSYFLFGKYNFAPINMNELIKNKIELEVSTGLSNDKK